VVTSAVAATVEAKIRDARVALDLVLVLVLAPASVLEQLATVHDLPSSNDLVRLLLVIAILHPT
jgi:hypothetical protein